MFLFVAVRRNSQIIKQSDRMQHVPVVAVIKQTVVPTIEVLKSEDKLDREKKGRTPCWSRGDPTHEVVEENSLDEKLLSVATDAGRDTLAKETKSKKGVVGSQPRGNQMCCSLGIREIPVAKSVRRQIQHEPGVSSLSCSFCLNC